MELRPPLDQLVAHSLTLPPTHARSVWWKRQTPGASDADAVFYENRETGETAW